jgi:hypothetical protein
MFPCTASPGGSIISTGDAKIRAILTWREGAAALVAFDAAPVAKVAWEHVSEHITLHRYIHAPRGRAAGDGRGYEQALEMRWNFLGRWDMF